LEYQLAKIEQSAKESDISTTEKHCLPAKEKKRYITHTGARDGESRARQGFARSEHHTSANHGGATAKMK
jgi:hypothetical protein